MKHFLAKLAVFLLSFLLGTLSGQYYSPDKRVITEPVGGRSIVTFEPEVHLQVIQVRDTDQSRWNSNSGYLSMYDAGVFDDRNILALYSQDGMHVSHDGGKTWERVFIESGGLPKETGGFGLEGLDVLDSRVGWAFGQSLIKTIDGGRTWTNLKLPEWIDNQQVKFLNENVGFIAGRGGFCERGSGRCNTWLSVYKTVNGGRTWRKSFKTKEFDTPWKITFVDENIAMIIGGGGWLYRTVDGGRSWKAILMRDVGRVMSISRSPDGFFWLFGKNSIRFSDDLGKTWYQAENLPRSAVEHEWWSVDFTKDGLGVAVSEDASILVTRDGGRSWNLVTTNLHVNGKLPVHDNPFTEALRGIRLYGDRGIITGSQRDYVISFAR
jgi:photosystem II stability/assembly factor-like uncharacterized protein